MVLNSSHARAVIAAAEAKAASMGVPVIIAVVDAGVHLKAFTRMDGAVLGSIDIALKKARTAALFQTNSEAVWEYCKPGAPAPALELTNGGLAPFGGGVPLRDGDGRLVGAVGVSGGAVAQDLEIAETAAAAMAIVAVQS
jgi:uncharacterized protein GlcG (DUF336 family)